MIDQEQMSRILNILRKEYIPFEIDKLSDEVAIFLDQYRQAPIQKRIEFRDEIEIRHGSKLLRCTQELAARAVRNNAIDDVALGLLGVAVEGVQSDFRNSSLSLCLLHHSAVKLGYDPIPLFDQAAEFGTLKSKNFILQYLRTGDKNIRAFAIEEGHTSDGFDYMVIAI